MGEWKQRILVGMIVVLLMIISVLTTLLVTGRSNRSAEVQSVELEEKSLTTVTDTEKIVKEQENHRQQEEEVIVHEELEEEITNDDLIAVTIEHEDGTSEVVYTDEEIFKVAATIGEVPTDLMKGELAEIANDGGVGTVLADLILKCVEYFEMKPYEISMEFTGGTSDPESSDYTVWFGELPLYITLWINPYNFQVCDASGHILLTGPEFKYTVNNRVESYSDSVELHTTGYVYDCAVIDSYGELGIIDEFKSALPEDLIERIETFPEEDQAKLFAAFIMLVDSSYDKASTIRLIGRGTTYVHHSSYFERCVEFNYDDVDRVMYVNDDTGDVEMAKY